MVIINEELGFLYLFKRLQTFFSLHEDDVQIRLNLFAALVALLFSQFILEDTLLLPELFQDRFDRVHLLALLFVACIEIILDLFYQFRCLHYVPLVYPFHLEFPNFGNVVFIQCHNAFSGFNRLITGGKENFSHLNQILGYIISVSGIVHQGCGH